MAIGTAASTASAVRWLSPLNTVDSSLAVTQKARNAFYIVALIHGLLVASSSQFILLPDIVTYAFLAYLAARAMSRAIAIVLVVLSIMDLILFLDTAPPGFQETLRIVIMVIAAGKFEQYADLGGGDDA